jgi:hypothetical protein
MSGASTGPFMPRPRCYYHLSQTWFNCVPIPLSIPIRLSILAVHPGIPAKAARILRKKSTSSRRPAHFVGEFLNSPMRLVVVGSGTDGSRHGAAFKAGQERVRVVFSAASSPRHLPPEDTPKSRSANDFEPSRGERT